MKKLIFILFLLGGNVMAADYIQYDSSGTITKKYRSVDGSNLTGNILKVSRTVFNSITKYHKVENGQVVPMTPAEKFALDDAEMQAEELRLSKAADRLKISNEYLFVALIKVINARIPSNPITKQEIINQLKQDLGL